MLSLVLKGAGIVGTGLATFWVLPGGGGVQWVEPGAPIAIEIGLSPSAVAAAGIDAAAADSMLTRLASATDDVSAYRSLQSQRDMLIHDETRLVKGVVDDPGDREAAAELLTVRQLLATARGELETSKAILLSTAFDGLGRDRRSRARSCCAAAASLPRPYLLGSLETDEHPRLAAALIAERRAARRGERLADATARFLNQVRADPRVVEAQQDRSRLYTGVLTAFEAHGAG